MLTEQIFDPKLKQFVLHSKFNFTKETNTVECFEMNNFVKWGTFQVRKKENKKSIPNDEPFHRQLSMMKNGSLHNKIPTVFFSDPDWPRKPIQWWVFILQPVNCSLSKEKKESIENQTVHVQTVKYYTELKLSHLPYHTQMLTEQIYDPAAWNSLPLELKQMIWCSEIQETAEISFVFASCIYLTIVPFFEHL